MVEEVSLLLYLLATGVLKQASAFLTPLSVIISGRLITLLMSAFLLLGIHIDRRVDAVHHLNPRKEDIMLPAQRDDLV